MNDKKILTINGGSSSIKFAVYHFGHSLQRELAGKIDRIGFESTQFTFNDEQGTETNAVACVAADHVAAVEFLADWLESRKILADLTAIGHRIVHGMHLTQPQIVTPALIEELHRICPYAPDHLPGELAIMKAFRQRVPNVPQMVCFDTAFHRTMPRVATQLPIPRRFETKGVQRYGFHGLSYSYLMQELRRLGEPSATSGRVILAHLGNGASMAAVRDGECIDTSMAFTPLAGLPMGTRSGDLDPGIFRYLIEHEGMTPDQFHQMANEESGLLGLSETSSDMRDLLAIESTDIRAAEAIELFCYQAQKMIGAYAAALGGLDTIVFAGGVGENSPQIRARICNSLEFLGVELNAKRNSENAAVISPMVSRVGVRVIPTDEENVIANSVLQLAEHFR